MMVCEGDSDADGQRELDDDTEALGVGLRVTVGDVLRLRVSVPVALRQSVPEELIEVLGEREGLLEALSATDWGLLLLGDKVGLVESAPLSVTFCEGEGEADGHWLDDSDTDVLRVRVRVTVGEALRLRVGETLTLEHIEPEALRDALGDTEGLLEALAIKEGGTLPLGDKEPLGEREPLEEADCEGELDADAQRDAEGVAPVVRDLVRVTVADTLRVRVGVPEALGHGVTVPLTEDDGDAEPQALAEGDADAASLPVQL